jgi:general secretion pathway protein G
VTPLAFAHSGSGCATGARLGGAASTERLIPRSLPLAQREPPPFGRLLALRAGATPFLRKAFVRRLPFIAYRRAERGFTMVEMAIVAAMITILAAMAIPVARYTVKRQNELELRYQLRLMRNAIDKFKQYSDAGLIPLAGVDSEGYPKDLETLVEGVDLIGQVNKKMKFLRRIPIDPMTQKPEWGLRSFQDEKDSFSWGGQNVYDVYSLSEGRGIDGTNYKDW